MSDQTGSTAITEEVPTRPQVVEVKILQAKNLNAKKKSCEPFVMTKIGGDEIHRTKAAHKTLDPVWQNESFVVARYDADTDGPMYFEVCFIFFFFFACVCVFSLSEIDCFWK